MEAWWLITLIALILERVLRLLDQLSDSNDRFGFTLQLAANLIPHYLGLTLPAGFFIALFLVVKAIQRVRREQAVIPLLSAPPSKEEVLLAEIRDLLKARA